jgi:C-terminal processing protease CtpA/Prc
MFTRKVALLNAALLLFPIVTLAQSERTRVEESTTTTTTRRTDEQRREELFTEIGWEVAAVDGGVRIERIVKNSPAAEAHLEEKDIIQKIAGENVLTPERVSEMINQVARDGETKAEVVVLR